MNVLSGGHAAEHSVAVGMCCGQIVARGRCQLSPGSVEWVREGDLDGAESDGDPVVGDGHVVLGHVREVFDLLPEDDNKDCGCAVPWVELIGADHALDGFVLGGQAEFRACSAPMWGHSDRSRASRC